MKRILVFVYGVVAYAIFFGTFLYAAGFIGNFVVPKSIDSAPEVPVATALLINLGLLGIFAVQHSVMARSGFKKLLTRVVPEPAERSTYVLFSSAALILMFAFWQPIGGVVWSIENPVGRLLMRAGFAFGWLHVLITTFLINHFDLFGLRQVWLYLRNREYRQLRFATPGPYNVIRHPLYMGWFFAFWSTPLMTAAHLVFAIATTAYILIAIRLEEKDLVRIHGKDYEQYQKRVPMLIPGKPKQAQAQQVTV